MTRNPDIAAHEASHVAVGVSLGLKLRRAVVCPSPLGPNRLQGWTIFYGLADGGRRRLAYGAMFAAGIAFERAEFGTADSARIDRLRLKELGFSEDDVRILVGVAKSILESKEGALLHHRVKEALLHRDLTSKWETEIEE